MIKGAVGTNITIKVLCGVMADTSLGDPYYRYAAVAHLMMDTFSIKCLDANFSTYLRDMTNTSWEGPAAGGGEHVVESDLSLGVIKVILVGSVFKCHFNNFVTIEQQTHFSLVHYFYSVVFECFTKNGFCIFHVVPLTQAVVPVSSFGFMSGRAARNRKWSFQKPQE